MDAMLSMFQSVSDGKHANISIYLQAFNEHQCFQKSSNGRVEFISHLTGLLSNTSTRYEGLLLLNQTLQQSSLDILEQKGSLWTGFCIKTCNQKNMFACVPMACRALGTLIEKSVDIPELSKAFTNHLLGNFFDSLKNSLASAARDVLDCVEIGLRVYPGACGPHRGAIEKFVGTFVDGSRDVVRSAAKCLHLLQQIRGGSTIGVSYQETWQKFQISLAGSLHEILDQIFADCPEIYGNVSVPEKWNFPAIQISDDPITRALQLLNRFKNINTYLLTALTEPFSVPKLIMPKKLLNLIQRGLAINCAILEKSPTANNVAIGALLPEIHIELYCLLDTLILTLKSNMAPYVHTFLSCVLETLKWTSSGRSAGFTKSYSSLRIAAYKSLSLWNESFKYGSCCELIAEYIIEQINNDITPFQNEVTLKVLAGKKHMSKKARRLLHKAQNEQSNISQTHSKVFNPQNTKIIYSDEGNQNLCSAALKCLKSIIQAGACFLKPIIMKNVLDTIFSIALHVINYNETLKSQLYANYKCRLHLYEAVYATTTDPHQLCPPPIQLVLEIFATAQAKDRNVSVRRDCNQYLKAIEKMIHPQKEGIYYPVDKNDIKNALKRKKNYSTEAVDNADDVESDDEKSEEEMEKVAEKIDLTELQNESEMQSNELPVSIQNISDTEDVIENISLRSSSVNNSPEIIEVEDQEPCTSYSIVEEGIEISSNSVEEVQELSPGNTKSTAFHEKNNAESETMLEPIAKRRRTTSNTDKPLELEKEDDDEVTIMTEGATVPREDISEETTLHEDNTSITDTAKDSGLINKSEDEIVDDCLADFVNELREN